MDIKVLIEKRYKLMVDGQALIAKENITPEDRTDFDEMIADSDLLRADISRMQAVEKFNSEQRNSTRRPRAGFDNEDQTEDTKQNQKRAFTQWMRTFHVSGENRQFIQTQKQRDLGVAASMGHDDPY